MFVVSLSGSLNVYYACVLFVNLHCKNMCWSRCGCVLMDFKGNANHLKASQMFSLCSVNRTPCLFMCDLLQLNY